MSVSAGDNVNVIRERGRVSRRGEPDGLRESAVRPEAVTYSVYSECRTERSLRFYGDINEASPLTPGAVVVHHVGVP